MITLILFYLNCRDKTIKAYNRNPYLPDVIFNNIVTG